MAPKEQQGGPEPQKPARTKSKDKNVLTVGDDPVPDPNELKKYKKFLIFVVPYGIAAGIVKLLAIAIICYSIYTAIVLPNITVHSLGRTVGLVALALVEVNLILALLFAMRGLKKYKLNPINTVAMIVFLGVLAALQLTALGVSIFGEHQEESFVQTLSEDFGRATAKDDKFVKYFHKVESKLHCCGLNGPEDYRDFSQNVRFPPDVTASCCPSYDSDLTDLEQNKARQICKLNRNYYTQGCKDPATKRFKNVLFPLTIMIAVSTPLVVILVALGLVAKFLGKKIMPSN